MKCGCTKPRITGKRCECGPVARCITWWNSSTIPASLSITTSLPSYAGTSTTPRAATSHSHARSAGRRAERQRDPSFMSPFVACVSSAQRLVQVVDQVGHGLEAHRQPEKVAGGLGIRALRLHTSSVPPSCKRRQREQPAWYLNTRWTPPPVHLNALAMLHKALCAPEAGGTREHLHARSHCHRSVAATTDENGQHAPELRRTTVVGYGTRSSLPHGELVLRM